MQNLYFPSIDFKNLKKFNKKFVKTYNKKPNEVSILAYDALGLIYYCWYNNTINLEKISYIIKKVLKDCMVNLLLKKT